MVDKQKAQQQHSKFLFDVAAEVEKLVNEPVIMTRFGNQIKTLCKMVVSYYSQPDKKNIQNPLDWFRPKASLSQPLNDKKGMMVNYVMLAVIHDNKLKPQWKRIYSGLDNLKVWPYFTDWANNSLWPWLRVWSDDRNKKHIEIYGDSIQEAETIRAEIQLALERVQTDLASLKPAETEQQKQADAEKTVIEVLGNYESENGNKKGMPLAELEQETERSWIELLSVLNSLGKKQLIEIHKGEGYVPYWLPVELDESPQLRGINANVWRFRLTSAGYELLKRETAQKPAETERKTNTSKVENKGIWGWIKKIALIATIIGTIVVILIFLFGDQICSPENEKTVVQQTMNDSPGGTQIAGDVYIEKRESNIYCELSPNIKRELILLLQKLREQYNDLSIKISVTSDKGSNVRHLVAKEMVNLLKDSGFEAGLTQPIIRFTNDTSDVVIKANESDIEFITQLSKILKKFIKTNTPFSGMKNENFRRGELQIIIAGDPLFSSDGLITFQ